MLLDASLVVKSSPPQSSFRRLNSRVKKLGNGIKDATFKKFEFLKMLQNGSKPEKDFRKVKCHFILFFLPSPNLNSFLMPGSWNLRIKTMRLVEESPLYQ